MGLEEELKPKANIPLMDQLIKGLPEKTTLICPQCRSYNFPYDDPDTDKSDLAHPAFWRGMHYGINGTVLCIRKILNEAIQYKDNQEILSNKNMEQLRQEILKLIHKKTPD